MKVEQEEEAKDSEEIKKLIEFFMPQIEDFTKQIGKIVEKGIALGI